MKRFFAIIVLIMMVVAIPALADWVKVSEAPLNIKVEGLERVDVELSSEPVMARVKIPPGNAREYVAFITDGYHAVKSFFCVSDDDELCFMFHTDELKKLDGTIGVYLIWFSMTGAG